MEPRPGKAGSDAGILIYSLKAGVTLAEALEKDDEIGFLRSALERMTAAAVNRLWDADRRLFVSGNDRQVSWATQAWLILAGVVDASAGREIFAGLEGRDDAVKPVSPYLYHHVVDAMFSCGMRAEAVNLLTSYWGGMVDLGADTFWEVFDPNDHFLSPYDNHLMNSYCHAWSCTPSYFLRR